MNLVCSQLCLRFSVVKISTRRQGVASYMMRDTQQQVPCCCLHSRTLHSRLWSFDLHILYVTCIGRGDDWTRLHGGNSCLGENGRRNQRNPGGELVVPKEPCSPVTFSRFSFTKLEPLLVKYRCFVTNHCQAIETSENSVSSKLRVAFWKSAQ